MSQANVPNITPTITLTRNDAVNLLLSSIAMEELGLSHIINAEGEKLQFVLGTLPGVTSPPATISDLLNVNASVQATLNAVTHKELLLQSKLDSILSTPISLGPTGPTGPTGPAFLNNAMFSRIAPFVGPSAVSWDTTVFNQAGSGISVVGPSITLPVGIYTIDYYLCANAPEGFVPVTGNLTLNGSVLPSSGVINGTSVGVGGVNVPVTGHYIVNVTGLPAILTLEAGATVFPAFGGTTFPNCTIRITQIG